MDWINVDDKEPPKDGTKILVCNTIRYYPQVAVWASYHPNAKGKECFRTDDIGGDKIEFFTHWMQLPEEPFVAN